MPTYRQVNPATQAADPAWLEALGSVLIAVVELQMPNGDRDRYRQAGLTPPAPQKLDALVDTGANVSWVDILLVSTLQLPMAGGPKMLASAAGNPPTAHDVHFAEVQFPGTGFGGYLCQQFGVRALRPNVPFDVVIGRDILKDFVLTYDGRRGWFELSQP